MLGLHDYYCKSVANNAIVANMSQINHEIATILKNAGLSMTKQRAFVFELLEGSEPVSMYELYDRAKGQLDRASLYRIIAVFEKLGIVQRVTIGWKYKIELSDKFAEHHHHLTCLQCGRIIPINETELETFVETLARSYKFKPTAHQVEIQGYCEVCAKG
jgi:Fur family ferric uptake transcriptional regulator